MRGLAYSAWLPRPACCRIRLSMTPGVTIFLCIRVPPESVCLRYIEPIQGPGQIVNQVVLGCSLVAQVTSARGIPSPGARCGPCVSPTGIRHPHGSSTLDPVCSFWGFPRSRVRLAASPEAVKHLLTTIHGLNDERIHFSRTYPPIPFYLDSAAWLNHRPLAVHSMGWTSGATRALFHLSTHHLCFVTNSESFCSMT